MYTELLLKNKSKFLVLKNKPAVELIKEIEGIGFKNTFASSKQCNYFPFSQIKTFSEIGTHFIGILKLSLRHGDDDFFYVLCFPKNSFKNVSAKEFEDQFFESIISKYSNDNTKLAIFDDPSLN